MEKNAMYFDVNKTKIYKDLYRPSTNISRFFKTLLGILIAGHSSISSRSYYSAKRPK